MTKSIVLLCASLLALTTAFPACAHAAAKTAAAPPQANAKQEEEVPSSVPELANTSIPELERLVAEGNIKAHVELGSRYGLGKGVERNYAKGIALIQIAADRNDPIAQFFLGTAYYHGAGVPKDEAMAVVWTERAANQNLGIAQYWMGVYIATGTGGVTPTWAGAVPFFWKAALQGNSMAAFYLGQAYNKGTDVDRNLKAAAYWYRRADSISLNTQAQMELALLIKRGEVEWQPGDPIENPKATPVTKATGAAP